MNGRITQLSDLPRRWSAPLAFHDRLLRIVGARSPHTALRMAALAGATTAGLGAYGPTIAEVVELFGPMTSSAARRVARRISVNMFRHHAGCLIARQNGYEGLYPVLDEDADATLTAMHRSRQPAILVAVHQGPVIAIGATLHRLSIPATLPALSPQSGRGSSLEFITKLETSAQRTAALQRCVRRLQEGGMVLLMLDGIGEATLPATLLGRSFRFRRGAATLARLTGVPLTPITLRWSASANLAMSLHRPLDLCDPTKTHPREAEQALIDGCAAWFDAYLRASPDSIRLYLLRKLLECAPVADRVFADSAGVNPFQRAPRPS